MHNKPFLLIRFLPDNDYCRDVYNASSKFGSELFNIIDANNRNDVICALQACVKSNEYPQFIYISSHAGEYGISRDTDLAELITWACLADEFAKFKSRVVLWIGACNSHHIVNVFNRVCNVNNIKLIVCFYGLVSPSAVQEFLLKMIKNTEPETIIYLDEEVNIMNDFLTTQLKGESSIQFYYPVEKNKNIKLINIDDFEIECGMTFVNYLDSNGKVDEDGLLEQSLKNIDM